MKRLLVIAAHPDDESFLFGGALAVHALAGGATALLCLTDGQAGRTGGLCTQDELGFVRRRELEAAAEVLGVGELITPGLMDGALAGMDAAEGHEYVRAAIASFGPDVLLTFGPEGASGHDDHKTCWRWTRAVAGETPVFAATFPQALWGRVRGGEPLPANTVIDVSRAGDAKVRAFSCHKTQQDHLDLHNMMTAGFAGREYYARVSPPWPADAAPATSF